MGSFSSLADTAYSLSVLALPVGIIFCIGAGGAINQRSLVGFWLTFPLALLVLICACVSASNCIHISFELDSLQCWAAAPSRTRSIDPIEDFGWGVCQYIGTSAISLFLIVAIWYRYKKGPLAHHSDDQTVKDKSTLKSKLAFWAVLELPFWK
jgi:hypothetical protein